MHHSAKRHLRHDHAPEKTRILPLATQSQSETNCKNGEIASRFGVHPARISQTGAVGARAERRAKWLAVKREECAARYVAAGWARDEAEGAAARTYTAGFARSMGF